MRKQLHVSAFIAALALFTFVNTWVAYGYNRARDLNSGLPLDRSELFDGCLRNVKVWDEAAIDSATKGLPRSSDVILTGSSAMIAPFWSTDRSFDQLVPNRLWLHHRATTLANRLVSSSVKNPRIYNLATPLQMVSDTYAYADRLLKGPFRPSVLVLGVTPREFYDHDFPEPDKTLNFLSAPPFSNWRYLNIYRPTWSARCEYIGDQICMLYSKRGAIQTLLSINARRLASKYLPTPEGERETIMFGIEQYARRYTGFSCEKMQLQLSYLKRISDLCRERQIELAVLNLPVPYSNRTILGDNYENYCRLLKHSVAALPNADYIDLSHCTGFADSDFVDSIHMNAAGGQKLIAHLAPYVSRALDDRERRLVTRLDDIAH